MRRTFQLWLLVFVTIAFLLTLVVSFFIQTQQSLTHSEALIKERLLDASEQIESNSNNLVEVIKDNHNEALTKANIFAAFIEENYNQASDPAWMKKMLDLLNVDELVVIDATGRIAYASDPQVVGYDMRDNQQSAAFLDLIGKEGESLVQDPQARGFQDGLIMQYAGVGLSNGMGVVQIGFHSQRLQNSMELADIKSLSPSLRVGSGGSIAVVEDGVIVSAGERSVIGQSLTNLNIDLTQLSDGNGHFIRMNGQRYYCVMTSYGEYQLLGAIPQEELYTTRQQTSSVLIISNLTVFLTVFILISWLVQRVVISGIYQVNADLEKITSGDLDLRVEVRTNREFSLLSDGINTTVDSLKAANAEAAARMDAELKFAKSIQFSSVPNVFPPYPNRNEFDIYATMDSAKEVGGDFYDFFLMNNRCLGFVIADVSGKGIGAALYMMRVKTQIKNKMLAGGALDQVIFDVNNDLCADNEAGMFVTAFVGICDLQAATLSYVNAGHNPPLIRHPNGKYLYVGGKRGFVLGGMENARYHINTQPLFVGDRLFLYTDGVTEATNPQLDLLGETRLVQMLNDAYELDGDMQALLTHIRQQIDEFVDGAEQADDITMLGIAIHNLHYDETRLQLPADKNKLDEALAFVNTVLIAQDVPSKVMHEIDIALDELFTNVASYAYNGEPGEASIQCTVADGRMQLCITDCGTPYNPLEKSDPDTSLSSDERPIGGLGIFLAKRLMDDIRYEYNNGLNQVWMTKTLDVHAEA